MVRTAVQTSQLVLQLRQAGEDCQHEEHYSEVKANAHNPCCRRVVARDGGVWLGRVCSAPAHNDASRASISDSYPSMY